jgi:hypothetical protein
MATEVPPDRPERRPSDFRASSPPKGSPPKGSSPGGEEPEMGDALRPLMWLLIPLLLVLVYGALSGG